MTGVTRSPDGVRRIAARMVSGIVIAEDALIAEAVGPAPCSRAWADQSADAAAVIPNIAQPSKFWARHRPPVLNIFDSSLVVAAFRQVHPALKRGC